MQIRSIGIDLGNTTFHLIALGTRSQVVIRKKFSRSQLLVFTAKVTPSLIGMEAGVGSHFLGRTLREQGHRVCPPETRSLCEVRGACGPSLRHTSRAAGHALLWLCVSPQAPAPKTRRGPLGRQNSSRETIENEERWSG